MMNSSLYISPLLYSCREFIPEGKYKTRASLIWPHTIIMRHLFQVGCKYNFLLSLVLFEEKKYLFALHFKQAFCLQITG
jgi:hypothetical protein